jgi:hypothetical protein
MHAASERNPVVSCWSGPSTPAGWFAPGLATAAVALGVVGEIARGEVDGPFYRLAFLAVIVAGAVALVAIHRGERSLVTMLAFVPLAIVIAFGAAQLRG